MGWLSAGARRVRGLLGGGDDDRQPQRHGVTSADHEVPDRAPERDQADPAALAPEPKEVRARDLSVEEIALRASLVVVGVLLVVGTLAQLETLLLIVLIALIIAAAMHQPVLLMEQHGAPRLLALGIAYVVLLASIVLLAALVGVPLANQVRALAQNFPATVDQFRTTLTSLIDQYVPGNLGAQVVDAMADALRQINLAAFADVPLVVAELIANIVVILFLSALLLLERDRARRWVMPLIERSRREATLEVTRGVLNRLGAFIRGQLIVMSVVGVTVWLGATLIGVPFAIPLGVLAFLVEAIPMIGPWIVFIPAVILGFSVGPLEGFLIIGYMLIVQALESYVLTPAVMGKIEQMSPVIVLIAILAGFALFGIVGALIAVPVAAAAALVVEEVLRPARRDEIAGDR